MFSDPILPVTAGLIDTPMGRMLALVDAAGALVGLDFERDDGGPTAGQRQLRRRGLEAAPAGPDSPGLARVRAQLDEYFAGRRRAFDLVLAPLGTPFQHRVWAALCAIPGGVTLSYRDLALRLGEPRAIRAVGTANGANPIAVVVPCHRLIGSDGSLTGYAGGLHRKAALLELEGARPPSLSLAG
ncbi:methylated-DNA-[protein]-cysteine S-methyltransferase [Inquilinus ginsengisoli]|uniref:Methylated-DNA--protein-cysteine methyltransferase n=1 Tax=Inquilinus ginsengisoli TaxID=363840 RepID=A0ABU1JZR8_9PROT|nr:methylated-DNA--[protein]-cysteine S-methyltransferase [Inquilinus ginsengisoli]MDR6294114.1 methylated-DNA-[protein]-cysteine S-methyltransferase [Inquilinus ginsengisoli]